MNKWVNKWANEKMPHDQLNNVTYNQEYFKNNVYNLVMNAWNLETWIPYKSCKMCFLLAYSENKTHYLIDHVALMTCRGLNIILWIYFRCQWSLYIIGWKSTKYKHYLFMKFLVTVAKNRLPVILNILLVLNLLAINLIE